MSEPRSEEPGLCPHCGAEVPEGVEECPNCQGVIEEADTIVPEGVPEGASAEPQPPKDPNAIDLRKDPTSLSAEEMGWIINTIRKRVSDGAPVLNEEIAYALKCISILRQQRPAKETKARTPKEAVKVVSLDDL